MIAAPLSVKLMDHYHSMHHGLGVTGTFATLGVIYLIYMMFGVFTVRVPAPGWQPAGYVPSAHRANRTEPEPPERYRRTGCRCNP